MSERDEREDDAATVEPERAAGRPEPEEAAPSAEPERALGAAESEAATAPGPASGGALPTARDAGSAAEAVVPALPRDASPGPPPPPARPDLPPRRPGPLAERPEVVIERPAAALARQSRRDFLLFTGGALAAAAGAWWLLPDRTKARLLPGDGWNRLDGLAARAGLSPANRERVLNRALTFDDDVAEALFSKDRRVRTYARSERTPIPNNYHGRTPGPEQIAGWSLEVSGLASGTTERFSVDRLLQRFAFREQVTRLVCVEGWSGVAWWGGIRFAELLEAFPPAPGARWAALKSAVSLDSAGRPETYFVSLDLETAHHPQTLVATHHDGVPLTLAHGAPLRLLAPVKLGLKNIKALTHIEYLSTEPPDYWADRGYSKYDGL